MADMATPQYKKLPASPTHGAEMWLFDLDTDHQISPKATCNRIFDFLFLGGCMAAENIDWLREMKITCVINVRKDKIQTKLDGVEYFEVPAYDDAYEAIHFYFDRAFEKIENHRLAGGRVLLNCEMGVSRSATICMMYMVGSGNRTLRKAYFELKRKRPCINPNIHFWEQMINTEKKWRGGRSSVSIVRAGWDLVPDVYCK